MHGTLTMPPSTSEDALRKRARHANGFMLPGGCFALVFSLLFLLLLIHLGMPVRVHADVEEQTATGDLVTGAASFILTPVYGAFKLAFAGAGAIVGGLTWAFTGGDQEAAQRVWDTSLKGTYIISPDHLSGDKPVEFIGKTRDRAARQAPGATAESSAQ